jgi:hypothetical protein
MTLTRGQTTGVRTTHLVVETCFSCGVTFGLAAEHYAELLKSRDWFYCPNGHKQRYIGKTEAAKLREELERTKRQLGYAETGRRAARDQAETAERRRRAEKGHRTRLQRKIAAGECPCCSARFPDLAGHMAEAHPDYTHEETTP